jgi:hypothetical protein
MIYFYEWKRKVKECSLGSWRIMEELSLREMWGLFDFKMLIQKLSARRHWPVLAAAVAAARLTVQTWKTRLLLE